MSGTILLADDSLTIQKVVELTFADTDHTVVTVSSGDELLEKLPSVRPDIVISDVIMPGTDGYNVCQAIKSDPETLHIPVILLTGTFEPFDRDRALAAGCDEIITKPFEARKLVETVEALLQGTAGTGAEDGEAAPETYEGAVAPPPVTAPPAAGPAHAPEFGTQLAPPPVSGTPEQDPGEATAEEPPEELDFTTSGFDRMRAAGEAQETLEPEPPEEGMEFDLEPVELEEASDRSPGEEIPASTPGPSTPGSPFGTPVDGGFEATEEPSPFDEPEEAAAEPAVEEDTTEEAPELTDADTGPIVSEAPAPAFAEEPIEEPEPVETPEEEAPAPSMDEAPTVVTAAPAAAAGALSDEDVERIARKVLELASERLERIAWEVIPDMAEIVVRERIRELEAEAEGESVQ